MKARVIDGAVYLSVVKWRPGCLNHLGRCAFRHIRESRASPPLKR